MFTLLRRCAIGLVWCCAGGLFGRAAGDASAQPSALAASRLELRVVPQTGTPGGAGGVVDVEGAAPPLMLSDTNRKRRFEIQYRVTGMPMGVEFDGLQLAVFDITASVTGGSTALTLGRALLSRDEAGGTGASDLSIPPGPVDMSAASANGSRGLHRPFRGIIPAPAPNNDYSANGVIAAGGRLIDDVTPVTIGGSGQSAVDAQGDLRWYGLYSFDADFGLGGVDEDADGIVEAVFEAVPRADENGVVWRGFVSGDPASHASTLTMNGRGTVRVQVPGLSTGMVMASGLVAAARRRRRD